MSEYRQRVPNERQRYKNEKGTKTQYIYLVNIRQ